MRRSLNLAAYRALSLRQPLPTPLEHAEPRPDGELLWAHATSEVRYSALCDLSLRLRPMRPNLRVLITMEQDRYSTPAQPLDGCDHIVTLRSDHPVAVQSFLDHWRPDLCLWAGGGLMPNLIGAASDARIPMILLDLSESELPDRTSKWLPDVTRSCLNAFDVILVNGKDAAARIRQIGVNRPNVSVFGKLRNSAAPPLCSDDELAEVTNDIASRPVWLAAHVRDDEFEAMLTAHCAALRLIHRLLLIVVTDDTADADTLRQKLRDAGLRSIDWDTGDMIEENTQVVVSRDQDNLGLWYRLAPLSFVGCSLSPGPGGRSPLEAAALGSAVLYGPHISSHVESYARLAAAGAARNVRDGDSLGSAVIQLIAPDHAAAMALAGWEVVTEGADLTDNLVELIHDALDRREADDARA